MTIFDELRAGVLTTSPEEMEAVGERLAGALPDGTALALDGDLGSGKTTFVRGLARGLGITRTVTSPTYTIYTLYQGTRQLLHMDAYRLAGSRDLDPLSLEEFLSPPFLIAVEWSGRVPEFFENFPTCRMHFRLHTDGKHSVSMPNPGSFLIDCSDQGHKTDGEKPGSG